MLADKAGGHLGIAEDSADSGEAVSLNPARSHHPLTNAGACFGFPPVIQIPVWDWDNFDLYVDAVEQWP